MRIEIDQSGRIEETNRPTVVAFGNGAYRSLFVAARTKRAVFATMVELGYSKVASKPILFSLCVFLLTFDLVKKHRGNVDFIIDLEYPGWEDLQRRVLRHLFKRAGVSIDKERISFSRIGKRSSAHQKAWRVFVKKEKAQRVMSLKELLKILVAANKKDRGGLFISSR